MGSPFVIPIAAPRVVEFGGFYDVVNGAQAGKPILSFVPSESMIVNQITANVVAAISGGTLTINVSRMNLADFTSESLGTIVLDAAHPSGVLILAEPLLPSDLLFIYLDTDAGFQGGGLACASVKLTVG